MKIVFCFMKLHFRYYKNSTRLHRVRDVSETKVCNAIIFLKGPDEQPIAGPIVARKRTATEALAKNENGSAPSANGMNDRLRDSCCPFAAKCFSVHNKESDATASFYCRDLLGHRGGIFAIKFSDDGTLLASGGNGVRLWPISEAVRRKPITSIRPDGN